MKLVIVSINSKYIHSSLAAWYLYSSVKDSKLECATVLEWTINRNIDELVENENISSANVIAFCCYIWNIEYVKSAVRQIKTKHKAVKIIFGGPEVGYSCKNYLNSMYADYVISGEGEVPFLKLIESLKKCDYEPTIEGVHRKNFDGGTYFDNAIPESPYTTEYFEALEGRIAYIETTRGCPFRCSFCLSGRDENIKLFPLDRVRSEILKLAHSGTRTIKFTDRSFNAFSKRALEIVEYIKQEVAPTLKNKVEFHFEIAGDILTQELIDSFTSAPKNLFRLEIGLQSFNQETLNEIDRQTDIPKLKKNIELLTKENNLHVHIDLIAGLPFETISSFKHGFNSAYSLKPDVLQLGFLKLLPGSPMSNNSKGDFSTTAPYEVKNTPWLSEEQLDLLRNIEHVLEKLSNSGRFDETLRLVSPLFETPYELFSEVAQNVGAPHKEELFTFAARLYDFLSIRADNAKLLEAMQKDMKNLNPVGRTPKFLRERADEIYLTKNFKHKI